ncbi:uncharacterized protein LOC135316575 isoform X2 [Phalacrocorax carbo]|uniref:uncharacterized protein LOC135316575 isoform X2 n=1 Tax=Phalacrocorax carbo TaxID=9209 RepID=UPI003119ADC9
MAAAGPSLRRGAMTQREGAAGEAGPGPLRGRSRSGRERRAGPGSYGGWMSPNPSDPSVSCVLLLIFDGLHQKDLGAWQLPCSRALAVWHTLCYRCGTARGVVLLLDSCGFLGASRCGRSPRSETVLRTWLSVLPPGMPLTAAISGLRGFSLPGVAILAARGRKGTHRALPGCGQELPCLKLERPQKGRGQPSNRSFRRGREETRRKKHLNWQILPAALRARAVVQMDESCRATEGSPGERCKKMLQDELCRVSEQIRVEHCKKVVGKAQRYNQS